MKPAFGIFLFYVILIALSMQTSLLAQFPKLVYEYTDLKFPAANPTHMFQDKKTGEIFVAGSGDIYKLNVPDDTWTLVDADPDSNIYPNAKILTMCIDAKGVFYAGCTQDTYSWISLDRGKKWKPIKDSLFFELNQFNNLRITKIAEHPDGKVFAATGRKIIFTADNGKTWKELPNSPAFANEMEIDKSGNLWAAAGASLFFSSDLGNSWTDKTKDLPFYLTDDLAFDSKGNIAVGKHQELFISRDGGNSWQAFREKFTSNPVGNPLFLEVIFDKDDYLYVYAYYYGNSFCISKDLGESWSAITATTNQYGFPLSDCVFNNGAIYGIRNKSQLSNSSISKAKEIKTNIVENRASPSSFSLSQNYPNPFNPGTTINYHLPTAGYVTLKVYDVLGREVKVLADEYQQAGEKNYQFRISERELSSGMYYYELRAGGFRDVKKMLLLK